MSPPRTTDTSSTPDGKADRHHGQWTFCSLSRLLSTVDDALRGRHVSTTDSRAKPWSYTTSLGETVGHEPASDRHSELRGPSDETAGRAGPWHLGRRADRARRYGKGNPIARRVLFHVATEVSWQPTSAADRDHCPMRRAARKTALGAPSPSSSDGTVALVGAYGADSQGGGGFVSTSPRRDLEPRLRRRFLKPCPEARRISLDSPSRFRTGHDRSRSRLRVSGTRLPRMSFHATAEASLRALATTPTLDPDQDRRSTTLRAHHLGAVHRRGDRARRPRLAS